MDGHWMPVDILARQDQVKPHRGFAQKSLKALAVFSDV